MGKKDLRLRKWTNHESPWQLSYGKWNNAPSQKNSCIKESHYGPQIWHYCFTSTVWSTWTVTSAWEKKIVTVLTFSNNKIMIWGYDKTEYHQEKTYLRKIISPVKTKKRCIFLNKSFIITEFWQPVNCMLSKTSKCFRWLQSYWD